MRITLSIIFTLISLINYAQIETGNVKTQADSMANALLNGDYGTLIDFTYPKFVEEGGGKEKMISLTKEGIDEMNQKGISILSVSIGEPSEAVFAGNEIHCIVSQAIELKVPDGKLKSISYLLAISKDSGRKWYFIDIGSWTTEKALTILPNFNKDLKIPVTTSPVFIKD
jgi:hypothetical protein